MAVPNGVGRVSKALRLRILERDKYRCVECNWNGREKPSLLHIDHKHPISKGGTNDPSNLRTLCGECNLKIGNVTTKCPNCRVDVDAGQASCPNCNFILYATAPPTKGSFNTSLVRRLLLAVGLMMLVYGLWATGAKIIRGMSSKTSGSCTVVSSTGKANFKRNCDSKDCDNDPSTVSGVAGVGQTLSRTGNTVQSSAPGVGVWAEVTTTNNETFYIASSKLSCN